MSFLKRLFGSAPKADPAPAKPVAEIEHRGFTIRAEPYREEGGQFQTAGTIVRTVDGVTQEHRFVRADRFASIEGAAETALAKGRQIIDEQGERLFPPS
jgi:hypothetical protein